MQTQTCRVCQREDECTKAQFCRYPLRGRPENIWHERGPWFITTFVGAVIGFGVCKLFF